MIDKVQKIREEVARIQKRAEHNFDISLTEDERQFWLGESNVLTLIGKYIDTMQEEPLSEGFAFKAIPRLLEMIEPTDRAKAYIAKLADTLEVEGYSTDAKIVRESLKRMNGEKVPMATMEDDPVSEEIGNYDHDKVDKALLHLQEEPASDDLKEELAKLLKECGVDAEYIHQDFLCVIARHFANWQKEKFEKNRLKHCDSITNEQAELEQGFIDQHLDKHRRMPTFLDAIEYGMRLQKEQMMKGKVNMYSDLMGGICIKNKWLIEAMKAANIEKGSMVYIVVVPKED